MLPTVDISAAENGRYQLIWSPVHVKEIEATTDEMVSVVNAALTKILTKEKSVDEALTEATNKLKK